MPVIASSAAPHGETERAFLQARLTLLFKAGFLLSLATVPLTLATIDADSLLTLDRLLTSLPTLLLGLLWLAFVRGSFSFATLRVLDASSMGALSFIVALMGRSTAANGAKLFAGMPFDAELNLQTLAAAVDTHASILMILGGAILHTFRAAVVPSPPRWTLWVTGVLGLPYVFVPLLVAPMTGDGLAMRASYGPVEALINYAIWWTIVTAMCTTTSGVIYGLRRKVRDAQRLGQYTLVEKLGEGGMGAVYRARHARLRRPTAIKLLRPDKLTEQAVARFETEVQLTAGLTHPNTITVFDYGRTDDGVFYYAMEYLDGATLDEVVWVDGAQPVARLVRILRQTASALQEAHEVGLVHRDIKPANIMLTHQGVDHDTVKLLDFGLVRPVDRSGDEALTQEDRLVGTPLTMAPEMIKDANAATESSDLYSLGAVGYFLLTGSHVFEADSIVEICAHHLHTEPEPPSKRIGQPVPAALEQLLLQCLAKSPGQRPASARDLLDRLDDIVGLGDWTNEDARSWWERKEGEIRSARDAPRAIEETSLTVAD